MKNLISSQTLTILAVTLYFTFTCGPALAQPQESHPSGDENKSVIKEDIVLGQSCALSGLAKDLGVNMRAGLLACFGKVNAEGGIKGRKIRLITLDDGYEPGRAAINTIKLIEDENVFLLIGEVGTPTSKVALPLAEEAKVPFFAPFTGAELLRDSFRKSVIHVRASYYQEMEALAAYLVDRKQLKKVACFYQDDAYGKSGLEGIRQALERRNMELCSTGTYQRNTTAIKEGLEKVKAGAPDAVIMVGAYEPASTFIKQAKKDGMTDTIFCNISFVGTETLLEELGDASEGCIVSEVTVSPWDMSIPLVQEYTAALEKFQEGVKPGFVSLEGYKAGKLFCMAANNTEGKLTREAFLNAICDTGIFDLGGVTLEYGADDHQGSEKVYLKVFKDGKIVSLD